VLSLGDRPVAERRVGAPSPDLGGSASSHPALPEGRNGDAGRAVRCPNGARCGWSREVRPCACRSPPSAARCACRCPPSAALTAASSRSASSMSASLCCGGARRRCRSRASAVGSLRDPISLVNGAQLLEKGEPTPCDTFINPVLCFCERMDPLSVPALETLEDLVGAAFSRYARHAFGVLYRVSNPTKCHSNETWRRRAGLRR
jgi:hypothetical protein